MLIKSRWAREGLSVTPPVLQQNYSRKPQAQKPVARNQQQEHKETKNCCYNLQFQKHLENIHHRKALMRCSWRALQIKQGHPVVSWWQIWAIKEPVSSGFSFSLASIYLDSLGSGFSPKRPCWPHSCDHSANMCWVSPRDRHCPRHWNQVLNKKDKDPANMRCSPESYLLCPQQA